MGANLDSVGRTALDRPTDPGRSGAVITTLGVVAKLGDTPSSPAPKANVTFAGLWILSESGDQERATPSVVIAATNVTDTKGGATPLEARVGRHGPFRLIDQKPLGGESRVSQAENRTYGLADSVRSLRRNHLRIASRDGVIDAEEKAIDEALIRLGDDLEQKADDERAAIALIRVGRTKHTRGIVVDLFPSIGPEAA